MHCLLISSAYGKVHMAYKEDAVCFYISPACLLCIETLFLMHVQVLLYYQACVLHCKAYVVLCHTYGFYVLSSS